MTALDILPADEDACGLAAQRRAIASLGAAILHARNPDAARRNGSRGGRSTAYNFVDGPSGWGKRMALARWHGVPFAYCGGPDALSSKGAAAFQLYGRAPMAGSGNDGGGAPEPGPAPAQRGQMVRRRRTGLEQARLL